MSAAINGSGFIHSGRVVSRWRGMNLFLVEEEGVFLAD